MQEPLPIWQVPRSKEVIYGLELPSLVQGSQPVCLSTVEQGAGVGIPRAPQPMAVADQFSLHALRCMLASINKGCPVSWTYRC